MKMKNVLMSTLIAIGLTFTVSKSVAGPMGASFTDPAWDGKSVPEGQQCQKFGGENPFSPEIKVVGIPEGTEAIVVKFNDESYQNMNYGGHGKLAVLIEPGVTEMVFPSVIGHSFDLPEGVIMISAHQAPNWDKKGAYMPPCSGGKRNRYTATIEASKIKNLEKKKFKKIKKIKIQMGKY
jgi:hypothetical protein